MGLEGLERLFNDWEVTNFQKSLAILHRQTNLVDNTDAWWWDSGINGVFTAKIHIMKNFWLGRDMLFHVMQYGSLRCQLPRKVYLFSWLAAIRVIFTV